jgi:hypothetical protein
MAGSWPWEPPITPKLAKTQRPGRSFDLRFSGIHSKPLEKEPHLDALSGIWKPPILVKLREVRVQEIRNCLYRGLHLNYVPFASRGRPS